MDGTTKHLTLIHKATVRIPFRTDVGFSEGFSEGPPVHEVAILTQNRDLYLNLKVIFYSITVCVRKTGCSKGHGHITCFDI